MSLESKLRLKSKSDSLIEVLKKQTDIPLIVWGMGSMSYNTRKMLAQNGLTLSAIWIDGERTEKYSDSIPIMSIEQITQRYKKINVVCGHSRYDLVEEAKEKYPSIKEIYCFVNICYGKWDTISKEFIEKHMDEYESSYKLFSDELSRECFSAYLNCKNTEDYKILLPCCMETATYFKNPFFDVSDSEVLLDVGAYNGDTIKEFVAATEGRYKKILAIEPEKESFEELKEYVSNGHLKNVSLFNNGCWNKKTTLRFELNEESSGISDKGIELDVMRIDEQFKTEMISIIKINYLSGVEETIKGAEGILRKNKPKLAIVVGFDEWGIMRIPNLIMQINPEYHLGLRYASPMPARLILFAF